MFLNPFAARDDHLKKVFRISMRSGPHLEGSAVSGFFGSLARLFQPVNDPVGNYYLCTHNSSTISSDFISDVSPSS